MPVKQLYPPRPLVGIGQGTTEGGAQERTGRDHSISESKERGARSRSRDTRNHDYEWRNDSRSQSRGRSPVARYKQKDRDYYNHGGSGQHSSHQFRSPSRGDTSNMMLVNKDILYDTVKQLQLFTQKEKEVNREQSARLTALEGKIIAGNTKPMNLGELDMGTTQHAGLGADASRGQQTNQWESGSSKNTYRVVIKSDC